MALGIRRHEYSELGVASERERERKDTVYTFITTIHTAIVAPSHTFQLNNDQSNNVNNKYAATLLPSSFGDDHFGSNLGERVPQALIVQLGLGLIGLTVIQVGGLVFG